MTINLTDKQQEALDRLKVNHGAVLDFGELSDWGEGWVWVNTPDTRDVPLYNDRVRGWIVSPDGRILG